MLFQSRTFLYFYVTHRKIGNTRKLNTLNIPSNDTPFIELPRLAGPFSKDQKEATLQRLLIEHGEALKASRNRKTQRLHNVTETQGPRDSILLCRVKD